MATHPLLLTEQDVEFGGTESIKNDFAYNNVANASVKIRLGFLRKVYGLLTFQLLISVVVGSVCMFHQSVRNLIHENDWLVLLAFVMSIVLLIALHFKRKESPTNLILLSCFTVVQAYTIGVVLTYYDQAVVLNAFTLTLGIVTCLSLYTFQTRRDFSVWGFSLFAACGVLIIGGILQIFIASTALELFLSVSGALLFSLFIIYDTQMIMVTVSPEEYILATINLYLDIVNLFLYILRALEVVRRQ